MENCSSVINEIKNFLFQGSVVNLLIAVIIGKAFADFIQSTVTNIILPLLFSLSGNFKINTLHVQIGSANILYGKSLDLLLTLIISTFTLYYIFIKPFNHIIEQNDKKKELAQIELIKNTINETEKLKVKENNLKFNIPNLF
jgi:large conductance mechanosensitive channel